DDPVSDSKRRYLLFISQPGGSDLQRHRDIRNVFDGIGPVGQRLALGTTRTQPRTAADAVHLALDLPTEPAIAVDREDLKLHARRTRVDDEDGIHRRHAAAVVAPRRRAWARRVPTAQDAMRARSESARDVSTTGTRAPSTMPALSALAK